VSRILSDQISEHIGKKIVCKGWLHKKRQLGGLNFINLRDRRGLVQILIEDKSEVEKLRGLQIGTVLRVEGEVVKDDRAPNGAELHEPKLTVLVPVTSEPPIEIDKPLDHKSENLDTLFENRVFGLRNLRETGIVKISAEAKEAIRQYLRSQEFVEFNSPKLLPGATEGGAEVFKLDYFGKEATLAQSAQFYKQIMVGVTERAFEINPTYRAELSATTRHMTEFIHVDAEAGFIDFEDLKAILSDLVNYAVNQVWEKQADQLKLWQAKKPTLINIFPSLPMGELHEAYFKKTGTDTRNEKDPTPDEERFASEYALRKWGSEAVFITEFGASKEAGMKFYHKVSEKNPNVCERADLIFRGVEISTLTMREHRYEVLIDQLKNIAGGDPKDPGFKYYLHAFKAGLPPHGGFGFGLDRFVQKIIGLNNVKEAALFPRDINRLSP
jgi:nondiscriminating aspartyl-tRNA synthetase